MKNRRDFLIRATQGLAALGTGSLLLRADAQATPKSGEVGSYGAYLPAAPVAKETPATGEWLATEDNIKGPFHRAGAPYRAKITPPLVAGSVMLIRGRVWGLDTRKPLVGATLDVWQANHAGRYDNDDPKAPPKEDVFTYRARMLTDAHGGYEYETIMPGRYAIGPKQWRPAHIHYWISAPGYQPLVTQLYFEGDKFNAVDPFIKKSLIISLKGKKAARGKYSEGTFDVVLAPA